MGPKTRIGLVLFPKLTLLDLVGPLEVFGRMPGAEVDLLWHDLAPVASDRGVLVSPTRAFQACKQLDVVCVPGGPGQVDLMGDEAALAWLREVAGRCRLVTSVCTGSLVLGAAGLLKGYRATSHWASVDQLALLGVIPVNERVVRDRNRITGAGVTSGIDFALAVVAELAGEAVAREIQLQIEYDPEPPFDSGSPRSASADVVAAVRERMAAFLMRRREATEAAARQLG